MSSPEVEKFEVTEDDLANEFFPRPGRRQTKHQAIYGMWADQDSDDDERPRFGGGNRKNNLSTPMNFVSGGIKQGDKTYKQGEEDEEEDGAEFNMSDIARLSRKPAKKDKEGKQGARGFVVPEKEFGSWERHTKGVGMKLMQKMGFEVGKGLGKNKQGITTPVEAVKRKGKATIGYYGPERTERSLKDFPVQDKDEEEAKEFQEQLSQWKKEPKQGKKKKLNYVYKTAQEAIDSGGKKTKGVKGQMSQVKVIDMTGKEQRVLTGYHTISQRHDRPDEDDDMSVLAPQDKAAAFSMPELMHNLNILVDMSEEDIIQNDRKLKHEKDLVVNMKYEKERLDTLCDQEAKQIEKLSKVLELIETCNQRSNPGCDNPITLDECVIIFKVLQNEFFTEYKMYDLESLAIALVFPLMREHLKNWDPMKEPKRGLDALREWKILLEDSSHHDFSKDQSNMNVYQRLIWDIWLPHIRTAVLKWNVRDCDPLIELLETWMPMLPPWVFENIQDQLVLPRLLQEVENWNPLIDTMPIHSWLHPWLPLMGDKLEPLYAPIRHKLANALTNWHPSDASAKVILQPWVGVWKEGHMEVFLRKNILPKLAMCMQEFPISPHQQVLEPMNWVSAWTEMIGVRHMAVMLEKTFFPRWLQVLCTWLGNMPNYDEVTKWYLGWKGLFSEKYLQHPGIKEQFSKALDMMNRAVSGQFQPGVKENIAYFTLTERRNIAEGPGSRSNSPASSVPQTAAYEPPSVRSAGTSMPGSFKEIVEREAEENNLVFLPILGRTQEAKQVYRCGNSTMYFDRNVIFMLSNRKQWIPVSISRLIECAKTK